MPLIDLLLPEFDRESGATRRVLACIPDAALGWQPDTRLRAMGELGGLLAALPAGTTVVMTRASCDISELEPSATAPPSTADLLSTFDRNVSGARQLLLGRIDGELFEPWTLTRGRHDLFTLPRVGMLRYLMLDRLIHHRGELCVYLQLRGITVPPIYGPG